MNKLHLHADSTEAEIRALGISSKKDKQHNKLTLLSASIAAALSPVSTALAQDQDQSDDHAPGALEEIIVTATHRPVEMQDVPQSIQAFSTVDIEKNNFSSLSDVSNAIPSLNVVAEQPGRSSVVFRGISTGTQEFYTDSQVAIYFDETALTFNSQQLWPAMVDIERVESLPGPQGTLFGSASQSGTLRIISNKPNHDGFSAQVFAEYLSTDGGDSSHQLNGWVNLPLVEDTMSMRLVVYQRDEGGWIDNVYGETFVPVDPSFISASDNAHVVENDQNTYNLKGARASILWDISEDWSVTLATLQEKGLTTGHWSWDPYLGDHKVTRFFDDYREDDWALHSLVIEGDLGFAKLTASTSYLDREIVYEWDNANYEQFKDSAYGYYAMYNTDYTYGTIFNDQHQDRLSQEIRLTSQSDSKVQWMIGGFYEEIYDEWFYGANNPDLQNTTAWYYANYLAYYYNYYGYNVDYPFVKHNIGYSDILKRTVEQTAFFGEVSVDFTDQFSMTFGGRYFKYDRDEFAQIQFIHGIPPYDPATGTYDWDNFGVQPKAASDSDSIFKVSATYHWDDDKMIYALFSQGFRLGGENSVRATLQGRIPLVYKPDTLDNYEIGIKTDWADGKLRVNLTTFRMEFDDYQFNSYDEDDPWWVRGIVNGGSVHQTGTEVAVTWQASDNLTVNASHYSGKSRNQTAFTFPNGDTMGVGDELANAPKSKLRFGLDYVVPQPVFGGEMYFHLDYSKQEEAWNSISGSINKLEQSRIPGSNMSNLYIGLNMPNDWSVTLVAYNVTDELWVNTRGNFNPAQSEQFGDPRWRGITSSQRPRTIGLNFRKNW